MADENFDITTANSDLSTGGQSPAARSRDTRGRKVIIVPLCTERQFSTLNSTTYKYYIVGPKYLPYIGPFVEDMIAHARGKDFTAQFNWKMVGEWSVDAEGWTQFASPLIVAQTSAASAVGPTYATRADFGLHLRFSIGVANGTARTRRRSGGRRTR